MIIPTARNVKSITDMRENAKGLLDLIEEEGAAYIFYRNKPKAVMLKMEEFVNLSELLQDYFDEKEAEKLAAEPRGKGIPLKRIVEKCQKYV